VPGYRIVLALIITIVTTYSLQAKERIEISEDILIMQGLWLDEQKAYVYSRGVYAELFDRTGEKEFLFREMTASLLSNTYINESIKRLQAWDKKHPDTLEVKRLLIPLYLSADRGDLAQKESESLLERSQEVEDLELVSNSLLYNAKFDRALSLLKKVYEQTLHEGILLRMVIVMDEYLNQRKEAIALLETHRRMHISSQDVYLKLLELYMKERDLDGLIATYKALYEQSGEERYLQKVLEAYVYKKDLEGAIAFLEKHEGHETILYDLYKATQNFTKALILADRFYDKDKNAKWLAEKGMLLFEKAEDKDDSKMLEDVLSYFEKAISFGVDDSIYLNYYGYTLIDKGFDVKKGMKIIQDALKQQPDNTFYLDSLAWGYYKQNECKKAYEIMKKVVEIEGLEQPEIAEHWNAIQKCK
jgi:tetratricopeptide (TPR) repeat protein